MFWKFLILAAIAIALIRLGIVRVGCRIVAIK
jgi:hypothetical protein